MSLMLCFYMDRRMGIWRKRVSFWLKSTGFLFCMGRSRHHLYLSIYLSNTFTPNLNLQFHEIILIDCIAVTIKIYSFFYYSTHTHTHTLSLSLYPFYSPSLLQTEGHIWRPLISLNMGLKSWLMFKLKTLNLSTTHYSLLIIWCLCLF